MVRGSSLFLFFGLGLRAMLRLLLALMVAAMPALAQTRSWEDQQRRDDQRTFCYWKWVIVVDINSVKLNMHMSEQQAADYVVEQYAYGPGGEMYRNSLQLEAAIREWTHDVFTTKKYKYPNDGGIPPYQKFVDSCVQELSK